jgi:hypothetical protein
MEKQDQGEALDKKSILQHLADGAKATGSTLVNDAALNAAFRLGLKDMQDATLAFPESQKSRDEPGSIGNPTQHMVTEQVKGMSLDDLRGHAAEKANEANKAMENNEPQNENDRGMER